jgi:hypothetical protein
LGLMRCDIETFCFHLIIIPKIDDKLGRKWAVIVEVVEKKSCAVSN